MAEQLDKKYQAIDVHAHFGYYSKICEQLGLPERFSTFPPELIVKCARQVRIRSTFVSALTALMPDGGDILAGNVEAVEAVQRFPDDLRFWVVLNPKQEETFGQTVKMLSNKLCIGIKIHPIEHEYNIREYGDRIFRFAVEHGAIVQSHSGQEGCWPMDFVPFANEFPSLRLIVSHLGCGEPPDVRLDHQMRAIEAAEHHNVWTDTSSGKSMFAGLIEWAVEESGSDRIFFGTDAGGYSQAAQHARIVYADISEEDKRAILWGNANALFGSVLRR